MDRRQDIEDKLKVDPLNGEYYLELGKILEETNKCQAYLCYENAVFLSKNEQVTAEAEEALKKVSKSGGKVPKASLVILSYNLREYTQRCIESIRETTPESAREIVIVDNNSKDDSVEYLKQQNDIVLIANDYNSGFPGGCNIGIRASQSDSDIFLLNNDTVMCSNSLFWLRMALYEDESVGATGCVTNHCSNCQSVIEDRQPIEVYKDFAVKNNIPMSNPYEYKVILVGFAVLIKRPVLEKIGYLDERYHPGNKEDDDICLRIRMAGYQNVLVHNSFLVHLGGKSFDKTDRATIQNTNVIKFNKKWGYAPEKDGWFSFYPDCLSLQWGGAVEGLPDGANVLEINCDLGQYISYLKWKNPKINFYGCDRSVNCSKICQNNKSIELAHYYNASDLPFDGVLFDHIILDTRTIKKDEIKEYLDAAAARLKPEGILTIFVRNQKHYSNWLPILLGDEKPGTSNNTETIWEADVNPVLQDSQLAINAWRFIFEPVRPQRYADILSAMCANMPNDLKNAPSISFVGIITKKKVSGFYI